MHFEFYNHDHNPSLAARIVRPLRRILRRLQRPYFFRLRDLLHWFYQRLHTIDNRLARLEQQQKPNHADYLAFSRRLAAIEDMISHVGVSVESEAVAPVNNVDLEEIAMRLRKLELMVDKLHSIYNLDEILPMNGLNGESKKSRNSAA